MQKKSEELQKESLRVVNYLQFINWTYDATKKNKELATWYTKKAVRKKT